MSLCKWIWFATAGANILPRSYSTQARGLSVADATINSMININAMTKQSRLTDDNIFTFLKIMPRIGFRCLAWLFELFLLLVGICPAVVSYNSILIWSSSCNGRFLELLLLLFSLLEDVSMYFQATIGLFGLLSLLLLVLLDRLLSLRSTFNLWGLSCCG